MSVMVMGLVWDSTLKGPNHRHVLLAMANIADDEGICWPGYSYLARRTDLSRRTVIRMVNDLEEQGWIVRDNQRSTSEGDQDTNLYEIDLPKLRANQQAPLVVDDAAQRAKRERLAALKNRRSGGGDTVAPPPQGGSDSLTPPSATVALPQCHGVTTGSDTVSPNTSQDTSLEEIPPTPREAGGSTPPSGEQPAASRRCEAHRRINCRPCKLSPRVQAREARERAEAELAAARKRARDCQWCVEHATIPNSWTRIDVSRLPARVPVTPFELCDHQPPSSETLVQQAVEDRARVPA